MYAVVTTGGKQYRVEAGSELVIERLAADAGASFTFDRVLLVGDGEAVTIGTPTVDGATVTGTVLGEELGPKLIIFKFKQKATYRRTRGHRQHLVRVRVDEISAGGKRATAEKAEPEKPAKACPSARRRRRRSPRRQQLPRRLPSRRRRRHRRRPTRPQKPARARKTAARRRRRPMRRPSLPLGAAAPPRRPSRRSNPWHTRRPARPAGTGETAPASDSASSAATGSTSCQRDDHRPPAGQHLPSGRQRRDGT